MDFEDFMIIKVVFIQIYVCCNLNLLDNCIRYLEFGYQIFLYVVEVVCV